MRRWEPPTSLRGMLNSTRRVAPISTCTCDAVVIDRGGFASLASGTGRLRSLRARDLFYVRQLHDLFPPRPHPLLLLCRPCQAAPVRRLFFFFVFPKASSPGRRGWMAPSEMASLRVLVVVGKTKIEAICELPKVTSMPFNVIPCCGRNECPQYSNIRKCYVQPSLQSGIRWTSRPTPPLPTSFLVPLCLLGLLCPSPPASK